MSYNRAYHGFFEGYTEKKILLPNGRTKIERVYAGDYYRHDIEDSKLKKVKVQYLAVTFFAVCCLCITGFGPCTGVWYASIPAAMGVVVMLWLVFYAIAYASHKRLLNIRQFRERNMLKAAAMAGAITLCLCCVGTAVWLILHSISGMDISNGTPLTVSDKIRTITGCICDASGAAGLFILFKTEDRMDYLKVKNTVEADPESYDIRYRSDGE